LSQTVSGDGSNKLVRMANQIAENFGYGDRHKAVAGIADHLMRFWTMEMKRAIVDGQAHGDIGLNPLAAEAVAALAKKIGQAA
jgi:formate dehydrogenase subunit delta